MLQLILWQSALGANQFLCCFFCSKQSFVVFTAPWMCNHSAVIWDLRWYFCNNDDLSVYTQWFHFMKNVGRPTAILIAEFTVTTHLVTVPLFTLIKQFSQQKLIFFLKKTKSYNLYKYRRSTCKQQLITFICAPGSQVEPLASTSVHRLGKGPKTLMFLNIWIYPANCFWCTVRFLVHSSNYQDGQSCSVMHVCVCTMTQWHSACDDSF